MVGSRLSGVSGGGGVPYVFLHAVHVVDGEEEDAIGPRRESGRCEWVQV